MSPRPAPLQHHLPAALLLAGSLLVLLAWAVGWPALLRWDEAIRPVHFNSGLCAALLATGLIALGANSPRGAAACGLLALALAAATALQDLGDLDLRIDEMLVRDALAVGTDEAAPGRMALLTAVAWTICGAALCGAATGVARGGARALLAAAAGAVVAGSMALVALAGYAVGLDAAYSAGGRNWPSPPSALLLLAFTAAMLIEARRRIGAAQLALWRWAPLVAAAVFGVGVIAAAAGSTLLLRAAVDVRRRAYEVQLEERRLVAGITDLQRGARGYVLSGQAANLNTFATGRARLRESERRLQALAARDAPLAEAVADLAPRIDEVERYAAELVERFRSGGLAAATSLEVDGRGRAGVDALLAQVVRVESLSQDRLARGEEALQRSLRSLGQLQAGGGLLALLLAALTGQAIYREASRRRATERSLRTLATFQTAILDSVDYGVVSTDMRGIVTSINRTAARWLGYAPEEVVGRLTPLAWHDPEEFAARRAANDRPAAQAGAGGIEGFLVDARPDRPTEQDWTFVRRDGSRFPVRVSVTALRDADGTEQGYLGVVSDLTESRRQAATLLESEERFRRAFSDAPIGMALVGPDGRWLRVNRALCTLVGYEEAELLRSDFQSITHPEDLDSDLGQVRRTLAGEIRGYRMEKRFLHRDGRVVPTQLSVSLVRDGAGRPLYFVSQIEDLTERRQAERQKDEFLGVVSHELKTPLTAVLGALDLLEEQHAAGLSPAARQMVAIAQQNGERLRRLVEDILDADRLRSGTLTMRREPLQLAALLAEALAAHEPYAAAFGVRLRLEPPATGTVVTADRDRLLQVLANLLSNAVKFSGRGSEVTARAGCDAGRAWIEVEDRGPGIPESFRDRMFERFAQAGAASARATVGTGLGLYITRQLVEAMGGTIELRPSGATTFRVELPTG
jgi:PAS domain S-box-containing protein